jgi:hypothetical protein
MSDRHYAHTSLKTVDAKGDPITYLAGQTIRSHHGDAFSDCLILGFSAPDKFSDVYVKLARPYAYVSSAGTTCVGVLLGVEEFNVHADKLKHDKVVDRNMRHAGGFREPMADELIDLTTPPKPDTLPAKEGYSRILVHEGDDCDGCGKPVEVGSIAYWGNWKLYHPGCEAATPVELPPICPECHKDILESDHAKWVTQEGGSRLFHSGCNLPETPCSYPQDAPKVEGTQR